MGKGKTDYNRVNEANRADRNHAIQAFARVSDYQEKIVTHQKVHLLTKEAIRSCERISRTVLPEFCHKPCFYEQIRV